MFLQKIFQKMKKINNLHNPFMSPLCTLREFCIKIDDLIQRGKDMIRKIDDMNRELSCSQ